MDAKGERGQPTPPREEAIRSRNSLRDAALCLGLIGLAFGTIAIVGLTYVRETDPARLEDRPEPECVVPAQVPYADLMHGRFRDLGDGRVEIRYDFDPLSRVEGTFFTDSDLYPQLLDWNMSLEGSKVRTGVVRGEGRLSGEARTRIAFEGPLEVELELELISGAAAIQIATNTAGEGYECLISAAGRVRLRSREVVVREEGFDDIATLSESEKDERRREVVKDLAGPVRIPSPVGRRLRVVFARTEEAVRVEIDGASVLASPLPEPDPRPDGNVALLSPGAPRPARDAALSQMSKGGGRALWDDVRITGRLSRRWLEERMDIATRLTGTDYYESDDVWPMARELASDGEEQVRTFAPGGDVDWITVAVPEGAKAVCLETRRLELGIGTEVSVFEIDGRTPLACETLEPREPAAARIVVPTGGRLAFYVRVTEPEGRCGTYRILAGAANGSR